MLHVTLLLSNFGRSSTHFESHVFSPPNEMILNYESDTPPNDRLTETKKTTSQAIQSQPNSQTLFISSLIICCPVQIFSRAIWSKRSRFRLEFRQALRRFPQPHKKVLGQYLIIRSRPLPSKYIPIHWSL